MNDTLDTTTYPAGSMPASGTHPRFTLSASSLSGDAVVNAQGEDLGRVHDLMIDVRHGKIAYAVLSFGGFLGMGDKFFAVPWGALRLDQQKQRFIIDAAKATLENAPGFDKDNWPDMNNTEWNASVHRHYGITFIP